MQQSFDFGGPAEASPDTVQQEPKSAPRVRRGQVTKTPADVKATRPTQDLFGTNAPREATVGNGSTLPANLAELESRIVLRGSVPRKYVEMASAIRTTVRVLGKPAEQVPTKTEDLSALLAEASPQTAEVSRVRWSRVKSLLLGALALEGFDVLPSRDLQGYSPLWQPLTERLTEKRYRVGLSRMLSYFSRLGVSPKDVTGEHIMEFGADLKARSLRSNPVQVFRGAVKIWNKVAASVEGWPQVFVELDANPRLYSAPWELFPASFRADVEDFQANSSDPDVFSETYSQPVRPATADLRRKQIHQVASALVATGFPILELVSLRVLVQPKNAEAALRHLLKRRGGKTGVHLEGQARLLRTIARHWVRDVEAAERLVGMSKGLRVKKDGMTPKNRQRLRQFDVPENVSALLNLPPRVFAEEGGRKTVTPEAALRVLRAMAVEILLIAPMRVRNLTQIEIGRHLLVVRRGKDRRYHIVFTPEETKTREPFEMELPEQTAALLEIYLDHFRPLLCDGASPYLFPGRQGECRSSVSFSQSIAKFVKAETGLIMHTHLFRQFAGKLYLDRNPFDVETMRRVLGHKSTATTMRSYVQLRTDHAFRRFDAVVAAYRGGEGVNAPRRKHGRSRPAEVARGSQS